jgi:hypothetical protein
MTNRQADKIADAIKGLPLNCSGADQVRLAETIADVLAELGHDRQDFIDRARDLS